MTEQNAPSTATREIVTSRVFDAPRPMVWKAWTEPDRLTHWYGPFGFSVTTKVMDVRPGGVWAFVMHGPDGVDYPNEIAYEIVTPPERLVYSHGPAPRFHVTVTFIEQGGGTLVCQTAVFPSASERDKVVREYNAIEGASQTLERLAEYLLTVELASVPRDARVKTTGGSSTETALASDGDLIIERIFDAPRGLVWKAWTEPDRLVRWFGPHGFTIPFCEVDLRPGGLLRFCHHSPQGEEGWGKGVYREVVEPKRIVYSNGFSDAAGNRIERPGFALETLVTVTFAEQEGRTKVTVRHTGLIADQGEGRGWSESMARLADFLAAA
jgi:uncharacterized protein YndB with AHSA1/START domain